MTRIVSAFVLVIMLLLPSLSWGGLMHEQREFARPRVEGVAGNCHVGMEGATALGRPGQPELPRFPVRLLLSPGETLVSIEVIAGDPEILASFCRPRPIQPARRLSSMEGVLTVPALEEIYASDRIWPAQLWEGATVHRYRGHDILTLSLCPVVWDPVGGDLLFHPRLELIVKTAPSQREEESSLLRRDAGTLAALEGMIDNPQAIAAYGPQSPAPRGLLDGDRGCSYLIVSGDPWVDALEPFVDFQATRGIKAKVVSKSWILDHYTGRDEPEQIRNFIRDAAGTWLLDYLLLVGDTRDSQGIPHRGLYCRAYSTYDYSIPSDLYYGALDGDWNDDGDGRWGEPGEEDFYPELAVGRACVSDLEGLENFIAKQILYQESPVSAESGRALMVGEKLFSTPLTWGGDFKDEVLQGSEAHGLVTTGFPADMTVLTIYERDFPWTFATMVNVLNYGSNIVNHQGHAYYNQALKINILDLPELTGDGVAHTFNFLYTQGCYAGSFDDKASYGGFLGDCFAELCTTAPTGFVAAVANSRYGWGDSGDTAGPSQFFDREFFDAIFGEGIFPIGEALNDSRVDLAWMAADNGAIRWCLYELNVFGDPSLELWTRVPGTFSVNHKGSVPPGTSEIAVSVSCEDLCENGAVVVLYDDEGGYWEVQEMEASGQVHFHPECGIGQSFKLHVWASGYQPYKALIRVCDSDEPEDIPENWALESGSQTHPARFGLMPNVPNPFNPSTRIYFELPEPALVDLTVYDLKGRRIRSLAEGLRLPAGVHHLRWDGRDGSGKLQSSGVYLVQLSAGEKRAARKLILAQ